MNKLLCSVLFFFLMISSSKGADLSQNSEAYSVKDRVWSDFRQKFSYHIQTIGILPQMSDGSSLIIISEPPPHTDSLGFTKFFSPFKPYMEIKQHAIGVDGWVKDMVIVLKDMNRQELDKCLLLVNRYLFFTPYKAEYLDLANLESVPTIPDEKLNFDISDVELEKYFITNEATFYPINKDKEILTLQDIFDKQRYGVFLSPKQGFVLLSLRKGESLYAFKPEIRQFTLESEIVLGAVCDADIVVIVGKARTSSVFALPPLRVETVLNLAAVKNGHLYQSYERGNPFAGKLANGKDWAPIALSDEIVNTELGSVLNITDQMLKSWSEEGDIEYQGFENFPKPASFPTSVYKSAAAKSVTYNWNTQGFAVTLQRGGLEFVTMDKTGCLPVSYIPTDNPRSSEKIKLIEKNGRVFFSELNNADLARVVSYTFLYQIFEMYKMTYSPINLPSRNIDVQPLIEKVQVLIKTIKTAKPESTKYGIELIDRIDFLIRKKDTFEIKKKRYPQLADTIQFYMNSLDTGIAIYKKDLNIINVELQKLKEALKSTEKYSDAENKLLDTLLVNRHYVFRPYNLVNQPTYVSVKKIATILLDSLNLSHYTYEILDQTSNSVLEQHINTNKNSFNRWIKTPTVVISISKEDIDLTGGHGLSVNKLKFGINKDLTEGVFGFSKDGVLIFSEMDYNRLAPEGLKDIQKMLANIPKGVSKESIEANIKDIIAKSNAPIREARDIAQIPEFAKKQEAYTPIHSISKNGVLPNDVKVVGNTPQQATLFVEKTEQNSCETMIDDIVNYLDKLDQNDAVIRLKNLSEEEANVIMKSVQLKTAKNIKGRIVKGNISKKFTTDAFDFSKLSAQSIEVLDGEVGKIIVLNIPKKNTPSVFSRLTIKGIAENLVGKVKDILVALFEKAQTNKFNFVEALKKDLKTARIEIDDDNIEAIMEDCIICFLLESDKGEAYCFLMSK